jgi:hypothetical protein
VHAATPSCPDERDDVLAPREHKEFPKPMTDEVVCAADVVVTMGCGMPARSIPASAMRTGGSTIPSRPIGTG